MHPLCEVPLLCLLPYFAAALAPAAVILATARAAPRIGEAVVRVEWSLVFPASFVFCACFVIRVMFTRGSLINLIEARGGLAGRFRDRSAVGIATGLVLVNAASTLLVIAVVPGLANVPLA